MDVQHQRRPILLGPEVARSKASGGNRSERVLIADRLGQHPQMRKAAYKLIVNPNSRFLAPQYSYLNWKYVFWIRKETLTAREEKLMSARTAAATVEKSLPVESTIEAEINSLIQQQTPKRNQVEQQTPKRFQIEDDAERCRSFVARMTSNSIDELSELASELTAALQRLQEYLKAEGERVQREIVDYAHLNRTALAAIKTIIETTRAPSNEKAEERI
jgi:hypothetical protein